MFTKIGTTVINYDSVIFWQKGKEYCVLIKNAMSETEKFQNIACYNLQNGLDISKETEKAYTSIFNYALDNMNVFRKVDMSYAIEVIRALAFQLGHDVEEDLQELVSKFIELVRSTNNEINLNLEIAKRSISTGKISVAIEKIKHAKELCYKRGITRDREIKEVEKLLSFGTPLISKDIQIKIIAEVNAQEVVQIASQIESTFVSN